VSLPSESAAPSSDPGFVEWLGALSLATDLANGAPDGTALRGALLASITSELIGLDADESAAATYATLFRYLGCTSYAHEEAELFGDESEAIEQFAPLDKKEHAAIFRGVTRLGAHEPVTRRALRIARVVTTGVAFRKGFETSHCEAAVELSSRLDVSPRVRAALAALYERWDGDGGPARLAGSQIPVTARVVHVAREALVHFLRRGGEPAARRCLERRAGGQLDPTITGAVLASDRFFAAFREEALWTEAASRLLAHLPRAFAVLPDLDALAHVFGDLADLKYPVFIGHSRTVADLATRTAKALGLGEATVKRLGRAAALHDIGTVAVPNRIWSKSGPLDAIEWERVRLHGYYGERICQRLEDKAIAGLVGQHHERSDGSGYARGSVPDLACGVLAAADVCAALGESRPHRAPLSEERIARSLELDAREGRLRGDVVHALLGVMGRPSRRASTAPEMLTERERDVLRLVARGMSNKEVGAQLSISPRTVQVHTMHAYDKLGVRTRAGAALRATEKGLL
jgi:HD-GYP domain-containing protein (c-di-GMP phosphodiesterase class II)